jgi:mRNA deadenylase 3'-5' endonuclease subunit Ccr4
VLIATQTEDLREAEEVAQSGALYGSVVKLRGGTNRLRIEQGRYEKEEVEKRICLFCDSQQVEDEKHFMLTCKRYEDLREKLWQKVEIMMACKRSEMTEEEQLNALLGDKFQPEEEEEKDSAVTKQYKALVKSVMTFITTAMQRRRRIKEASEGVKSTRVDTAHRPAASPTPTPTTP